MSEILHHFKKCLHMSFFQLNFPQKISKEEEELLLGEGLPDAEPAPHHEGDAALVSPVEMSRS